MLGRIFSVMIIASFIFGGLNGNMDAVCTEALSGACDAVKLSFNMLGVMCLWSGTVRVLDRCGATAVISRIISPIITLLYPNTKGNSNAINAVASSFSANFLGLGNAGLPLGLRAMNELKKLGGGDGRANDETVLFAVINTAPFQLIPTTLIALLSAHGSALPSAILLPIWICSALTAVFAVFICRLLAIFFK